MSAVTSLKGRGALTNPANRFAVTYTQPAPPCGGPGTGWDDAGWDDGEWDDEAEPARVVTEVRAEVAKQIITRNSSPDVPFSQSINPYQGCEHGCIYCFARPTHGYWDLSPGLDFETKLAYKTNAAELLEKELSKPSYRCRPIALGANTDPYQPLERQHRVTRQLLEVLQRYNHPFTVTTKSQLVLRDLDILAPMAAQRLCRVLISVTSLEQKLMRRLEPRAASPKARLQTIRQLNQAGVPVGVLAAPIIPSINDAELESILAAAHDAGANSAGYILIRLPHEVKTLFSEWLQTHFPGRAQHVLSLIAQCRDGQLYDSRFGQRMQGSGVVAELIAKRFEVACRRLGLRSVASSALDCSRFNGGEATRQLSLFG